MSRVYPLLLILLKILFHKTIILIYKVYTNVLVLLDYAFDGYLTSQLLSKSRTMKLKDKKFIMSLKNIFLTIILISKEE